MDNGPRGTRKLRPYAECCEAQVPGILGLTFQGRLGSLLLTSQQCSAEVQRGPRCGSGLPLRRAQVTRVGGVGCYFCGDQCTALGAWPPLQRLEKDLRLPGGPDKGFLQGWNCPQTPSQPCRPPQELRFASVSESQSWPHPATPGQTVFMWAFWRSSYLGFVDGCLYSFHSSNLKHVWPCFFK